jgi:hypothetical protein
MCCFIIVRLGVLFWWSTMVLYQVLVVMSSSGRDMAMCTAL